MTAFAIVQIRDVVIVPVNILNNAASRQGIELKNKDDYETLAILLNIFPVKMIIEAILSLDYQSYNQDDLIHFLEVAIDSNIMDKKLNVNFYDRITVDVLDILNVLFEIVLETLDEYLKIKIPNVDFQQYKFIKWVDNNSILLEKK